MRKHTLLLYCLGLPTNMFFLYFCTIFCNVYPNSSYGWFQGVGIGLLMDIFVLKLILPIVLGILYYVFLRGCKCACGCAILGAILTINFKNKFLKYRKKIQQ